MGYFHREGTSYLTYGVLASLLTCGLYAWTSSIWFLLAFVLALFFLVFSIQFFRYPSRPNPQAGKRELVSPADGKLVANELLEDGRRQLSIFMSPLNVHANWVPIKGKIISSNYISGKYLVAWHPKSSSENERHEVIIELDDKTQITVKQIAGAVARRVCCYLKEGHQVEQGDELGFIKFGSRVDLLLPSDAQVHVEIGDVVKGNTTLLGTV